MSASVLPRSFCHCDELSLENLLCKSSSQCHSDVLTCSVLTSNSATSIIASAFVMCFAVNADLWTSCTNALYGIYLISVHMHINLTLQFHNVYSRNLDLQAVTVVRIVWLCTVLQ